MKQVIYFFSIICIIACFCIAQSKYIQEGSIGNKVEQPDTIKRDCFTFRQIEKWEGEKFIFIPKTKFSRQFGYVGWKVGKGEYGKPPTYEECVGRIGTVIEIKDCGVIKGRIITLKMDDDGSIYTKNISIVEETVSGIAPIADVDSARARWLGKTLFFKRNELLIYDEEKDDYQNIETKRLSPVEVQNIIVGTEEYFPIRFILKTIEGEVGYIDVNLSGTNVPWTLRDGWKFEDYFFEEDPKITFRWSEEIWKAIEEEKVFIGMTSKQAEISWGKPKKINKTFVSSIVHEQWVYYSGSCLYFENGILTGIQN